MEVMQVLHMNKGHGETSYARNSTVQSKIISIGKPAVEAAINDMLKENVPESVGIADLGCSSGPNSLSVISQILETIQAKCCSLCRPVPELRVYLSDLYSNDFNELFLSLPTFYKTMKEKGIGSGSCFVSGVPGSFYGRLFPASSLNFVHSSSSLHWLSQVPAGLESNASIALNKGKIYISKSSPKSVVDAYSSQFQRDFWVFLRSRSPEVAAGGRMVLSFMGRRSGDPTTEESCYHWELLAHALMALVREGLVEEEKIDSFNAPYYGPCPEEIKREVEKEGSFFIERFEGFEVPWDGSGSGGQIPTPASTGQRVAQTIRAVVESMLGSHFGFGESVTDHLFRIYAQMVGDYLSRGGTNYFNLVITLVKRGSTDHNCATNL